jgi:signal peptidase I
MIEPRPHTDAEFRSIFSDKNLRDARPRLSATQKRPRPRRLVRWSQLLTVIVLIGAIAWFFTLRPTVLGGSASYVMVSGVSMKPLYQNGDVVILQTKREYHTGDIVAYHVPAGEVGAGSLVIHRIVGSDDKGLITKGDNRKGEDLWRPQQSDVIGKAWIHLPRLGKPLSVLHAPLPLAAVAAAFTVYFVLTFNGPKKDKD